MKGVLHCVAWMKTKFHDFFFIFCTYKYITFGFCIIIKTQPYVEICHN